MKTPGLFGFLSFVVVIAVLLPGSATDLSGANQDRTGADPFIGTWNLDLNRSIYSPGPAPLSQTRIYESTPDGRLKATLITVDRQGDSSTVEYEAGYDGVEYPYLGSMNIDAIELRRINDTTMEATLTLWCSAGDVPTGRIAGWQAVDYHPPARRTHE